MLQGPDGYKPAIFEQGKESKPTNKFIELSPGQALRHEISSMPKGAWDGVLLHSVPFIMAFGMIGGGCTALLIRDTTAEKNVSVARPTPTTTSSIVTPTPLFTDR